jgi:hypothetical protein
MLDPVEIPDNAPEHTAIIATWWNTLPATSRPYTQDRKPPYAALADQAVVLARRGVTRAHVAAYIKAKYQEDFWRGKSMTFGHISDKLPSWVSALKQQPNRYAPVSKIIDQAPTIDPHCPVCGGTGKLALDVPKYDPAYGQTTPCPACVKKHYQQEEVVDNVA